MWVFPFHHLAFGFAEIVELSMPLNKYALAVYYIVATAEAVGTDIYLIGGYQPGRSALDSPRIDVCARRIRS